MPRVPRTKLGAQAGEDVHEQAVEDVQDLAVVLVDGHLQVQAHKLAQVPVRERLLRPARAAAPGAGSVQGLIPWHV
jgi:hypothetical protein